MKWVIGMVLALQRRLKYGRYAWFCWCGCTDGYSHNGLTPEDVE